MSMKSNLKKGTRPKRLAMPEKNSKEINILTLGYSLAFAFTYSELFILPCSSLPASAIFAIVLQLSELMHRFYTSKQRYVDVHIGF